MKRSLTAAKAARAAGAAGAAVLGAAALLPLAAGTAAADTPSPSAADSASAGASATSGGVAGTTFRTASALGTGQQAQASGSVGDYLYWSFAAKAGQTAAVTATVQLPPAAQRHGTEEWRLDLYDGLRRKQPCTHGAPVRAAAQDTATVAVSCTLPRIRAWAASWSNAPLPGTYYVRLTVGATAEQDLGLPFTAQVALAEQDGPAQPAGSTEVAPVAMPSAGPSASADATAAGTASDGSGALASAGGRSFLSGRHARWWWTGLGAGIAAVAGVAGFTLTRHPRGYRQAPRPVPPAEAADWER